MKKIPTKAIKLRKKIVEQKNLIIQLENHGASPEKLNYEEARLQLFETALILFIKEKKKDPERKKIKRKISEKRKTLKQKKGTFPLTILN